ncbi:putative short-chain dehydrogenase [Canariomyces notabilis]|uniref:Short-chain dehydrogenase n=1 Tax=Canariomyces notabilis TaxID=2074819 RepID=A0AAN6YU87_9PEZI|nr:putative short-chain dehydrogenase [Canariomyces arenarius]
MPRPTKTYHQTTYDRIAKQHGFRGAGKTILVTGGSSGVGFSISKAFAAAGAARIAIVSRSPRPQERAKAELEASFPHTLISTYATSVTDSTRMAGILRDLGRVDVLVLGAAVLHRRAASTDITAEEVQEAFDTNVVAAFNLIKAYLALPTRVGQGDKTVINISSAAAQVQSTRRVGYGSSKAALAMVMQHFAVEQAQQSKTEGEGNVRLFSFHPGTFYTPSVAEHYARDEIKWDDLDLPAHFALWLAGPESSFLHGRFVWANWDVDELIALKERLMEDQRLLTFGLVL